MSRTVDIDVTFRPAVGLDLLLSRLTEAGWSAGHEGKINYMVDDFDWRYADEGDGAAVRAHMQRALESGEVAGISLWSDEGHGVNVLIFPGMEKVSFGLDLNRRLLEGSAVFADLGWYLARIVPPLESAGLTGVTAKDVYP